MLRYNFPDKEIIMLIYVDKVNYNPIYLKE